MPNTQLDGQKMEKGWFLFDGYEAIQRNGHSEDKLKAKH